MGDEACYATLSARIPLPQPQQHAAPDVSIYLGRPTPFGDGSRVDDGGFVSHSRVYEAMLYGRGRRIKRSKEEEGRGEAILS